MSGVEGAVLTNKGLEEVAALEVRELTSRNPYTGDGFVLFKAKSLEELFRVAAHARSASRVLLLTGRSSEGEGFKGLVENLDFSLLEKLSFKVESDKGSALNAELGAFIVEEAARKGVNAKVSLGKPGLFLHSFSSSTDLFLGVDLSGPLSKREYKVFQTPNSIRGNVAYALARLAGFKRGSSLLDPFSGSGEVCVEAALHSAGKPVKESFPFQSVFQAKMPLVEPLRGERERLIHCFDDSLRNVKYCKNNALIAGVSDWIHFSKLPLDALDTVLEDGCVDCVATKPPQPSKHLKESKALRIMDELFYQLSYCLSDKGLAAFLIQNPSCLEPAAEKHGFSLVAEKTVWTGYLQRRVFIFEKT